MDDYSSALRAVENTLRDFIQEVLIQNLGANWVEQCGVTPQRIVRWRERREDERRKMRGRGIDERLLYYADFYDLSTILRKHWQYFEPCFGKWRTMEVYLEKLEDFRNPDAHRRELFPYEAQLILGITGEIRTAVTNVRSQRKPEDEFFPKFEQVVDSFGNVATPQRKFVSTGRVLYPGDEIYFSATAWDPKGETCEFELSYLYGLNPIVTWTSDSALKWTVSDKDIGRSRQISLRLRSKRNYHATESSDDHVGFEYTVLPKE